MRGCDRFQEKLVKTPLAAALAATTLLAAGATLAADKPVPAAAAAATAQAQANSVPDMVALRGTDLAWVKHFNAGNPNGVAVLYEENAVLLPPNAPAVTGRAAIRSFLAGQMSAARKAGLTFALGADPAGGISGDMGWQSGTYTVKDQLANVVESGKYLSVFHKQGRKWYYVRDTWNSDGPPAASGAPAAAEPKK